jgi:hypothetical protein
MREISICSHKCCIAPAREVNAHYLAEEETEIYCYQQTIFHDMRDKKLHH